MRCPGFGCSISSSTCRRFSVQLGSGESGDEDDETILAIEKNSPETDHISNGNYCRMATTTTTRRKVIRSAVLSSSLKVFFGPSRSASAKEVPIRRDHVNDNNNDGANDNVNNDASDRYGTLYDIHDPNTYSALVYKPNPKQSEQQQSENNTENKHRYPVIILLHGAGNNDINDVWNLANPNGEHAGLIPSLLYNSNEFNYSGSRSGSNDRNSFSTTSNNINSKKQQDINNHTNKNNNIINIKYSKAPVELLENFVVIAPYSYGKRSFYEEPRSKILQFVKWACSYVENVGGGDSGGDDGDPNNISIDIDTNRLFLFGFSDGATLGVELMTTRYFAGGIFAAYGFTGKLPSLALERLKGQPMWIFHSADDVIFPVACSDKLVDELRSVNKKERGGRQMIRYTRFDKDQEGFTGSVKGHSTGITASKDQEVYKWLLSL
eukprot:CAMPEP_0203677990 /NCGR_PEP_ID=MMETSP0090-20130426/30281_1 /ASSEMBLY_ACC=CAM_ASM_001088 /TAXON_ID=426623 /ORGANISM="Chaetoceros affinis, Strain CCMP159" /LENGTH=436 /DNA_ID=CAMNT_0050545049 /DNA_START=175 /DNA_END=1485 /DNA_ORIENTATION=-